jgi:putative drug exporter of the RND superfamily
MFDRLGSFVFRRRLAVLAATAFFLAMSVVLLVRGGRLTTGTIGDSEAREAQVLVDEVLGHPSRTTFVAIMQARTDLGREELAAAVDVTVAPLRGNPDVVGVVTPADAPSFLAEGMVNDAEHVAMVLVTLRGEMEQAVLAYPAVRAQLEGGPLAITCTGEVPFHHDMAHTLAHDLLRAELIALPLALLVLLFVFRTAVAAALPVGVGSVAVAGGVAVVLALSRSTDMAQYTVNVCSLVGLGLAIDYSLFIVSRYREELALGHDYERALGRTLATAGRTVTFSGLAVGTGLAGLLFFRGSYLVAMGIGGAIVVALAVVFALTFLPALLAVLGPLIHKGRLPLRARASGEGPWRRVALWVMRHPWRVLVPTLGVLLFMSVPFLRVRIGAADVRILTADVEARRGYDLVRRVFPGQAAERALVAVQFPTTALGESRIDAIYDLSRRIAAIPHVARVESMVDLMPSLGLGDYRRIYLRPRAEEEMMATMALGMTKKDTVVLVSAVIDAPPNSDEARDVVRAIRAERHVGDGTLIVGGRAAKDVDDTEYVKARVPMAVGFVVASTLVILFFLLGSVVLPIKAVLMNFVSIGGSFGAVVWLFQEGHWFGAEARPLDPSTPILLFCVLFGLSMDYEVLMLSRIKESRESGVGEREAVADGLAKTAGLITSAAAIMIVVFATFAFAHVVVVQAVGVGMALAVLVDATLVRVLLVPATMRLLGELNWWAPRPLRWLHRRLSTAQR